MDVTRAPADAEFEAVLAHIKESRGFDFTGYKQASLERRIRHRMGQIGIAGYGEYLDHLQVDSDEFAALFNTILINVTNFFRDPEAWEALRADVVPALLAGRDAEHPLRIWSAGCASGQEAYTLAMVFAEAMTAAGAGPDEVRARLKIYATDVDEQALAHARQAAYTEAEVADVPPDLLERHFEQQAGRFVFRKDLRRSVIFGRNDLVQDAPISRIDLLVCRNTLMYFTAETQAGIVGRFQFALAPAGVLFLGKAEMLLSHSRVFDAIDLKQRVFRKAALVPSGLGGIPAQASSPDRPREMSGLDELREHAFTINPVAQIVVTGDGVVALVNAQAEQLFGLSNRDIGRPLRDLDVSYRPAELRSHLEQCKLERRGVRIPDVEWRRGADPIWLDIGVDPIVAAGNGLLGVSLVFRDVTAARRLQDDLERTNRQLESAYEELQSTNEELETTNEELQSTVEELETTNEELQSTNEELETMNEELQSTNDELQSINNQLRDRGSEIDDLNDFLESILTSLHGGVVVVDTEMRVLVWNRGAEELWGLRRHEAVGEHLLNLDIGLPLPELRPHVRAALADPHHHSTIVLDAVNRRGKNASIRVQCGALRNPRDEVRGAILWMEPAAGSG